MEGKSGRRIPVFEVGLYNWLFCIEKKCMITLVQRQISTKNSASLKGRVAA